MKGVAVKLDRHPLCPTHNRPLEFARGSLACPSCAAPSGKLEAQWRQCTRKRAFRSRSAAERFGAAYGNSVYRCNECKQWHTSGRGEAKTK